MHEEEIDLVVEGVPLTSEIQDTYDPLKSGLLWYVPPSSTEKEHKIGGHEWVIAGSDMQVLTMTVPGGETILTETGSFMFMAPHMETEVELTLCTKGGCSEGCNRIWGGESCVKVSLINNSSQQGYVGLTPNFPAKIIPVSPFFKSNRDRHFLLFHFSLSHSFGFPYIG